MSCTPWQNWGFNYILKLEAEFNGRHFSGEGVLHIGWTYQLLGGLDQLPEYLGRSTGEAVTLLDSTGDKLFALIAPPWSLGGFTLSQAGEILWPFIGPYKSGAVAFDAMAQLRGVYPIPPERRPVLVAFKDVRRPETVMILGPDDSGHVNNPVRITRATMQVTDRRTTFAIEQELPWLSSLQRNFDILGRSNVTARIVSDAQRLQRFNFQDQGEF